MTWQVVEKGVLPCLKHAKQKYDFCFSPKTRGSGTLGFCQNISISIQAVKIQQNFNCLLVLVYVSRLQECGFFTSAVDQDGRSADIAGQGRSQVETGIADILWHRQPLQGDCVGHCGYTVLIAIVQACLLSEYQSRGNCVYPHQGSPFHR
jgi:hypothetical protein